MKMLNNVGAGKRGTRIRYREWSVVYNKRNEDNEYRVL